MSVTAKTVAASVDRWIAEAAKLEPRAAYKALSGKARFINRQMARHAGPAWDLALGRDRLMSAATTAMSAARRTVVDETAPNAGLTPA